MIVPAGDWLYYDLNASRFTDRGLGHDGIKPDSASEADRWKVLAVLVGCNGEVFSPDAPSWPALI